MYIYKTYRENFYNNKDGEQTQHKIELNEKSVKTDKIMFLVLNDIEKMIEDKKPTRFSINGFDNIEEFEDSITRKQERANINKIEINEYAYYVKDADKTEEDSVAFRKEYIIEINVE